MNFETAIRTCLSKYAMFSGRAPRSEFWWFYLFVLLADMVAAGVDAAAGARGILSGIVHLLLLAPSLAVGARRLHDIGRSGWWQLVGIVPLLGWIVLIYWWTRPPQPGVNAYGEEPRVTPF